MHPGADVDVVSLTHSFGPISPEERDELQVMIYVLLVAAGMLIWDIVSHLGEDYQILTKYSFQTPVLVYFVSRLSALGLCITGIIMGPARIDMDCHIGARFLEIFFSLIIITTTGLFALRVRAVYVGCPTVRTAFLLIWLAVVGSCFLTFFVVDSSQNAERTISSCLLVEKNLTIGVLIAIIAMVHDTAVFLAISLRIYTYSRLTDRGAVRPVVVFLLRARTTTNMPPLLRSLVQDGQLFYLISLFWEVLAAVLLVIPSIGPYYRGFMLPAHLVIVNSIASLVFRNVRLGKFREEAISYKNTTGHFTSMVTLDAEQAVSTVQFAHPVDSATTASVALSPMHTWNKDGGSNEQNTSEAEGEKKNESND